MVETSNRIGGGAPSPAGPVAGGGQAAGAAPHRMAPAAGGGHAGRQATPFGPRGRRMLSPDTPVESLDRSAPRGTYLDILV